MHVQPIADAATHSRDLVESLARELSEDELELPSFPDAAEKVRRTLEDPDCSGPRLVRAIGADPALAGQIVRLANSAANRPGPVRITTLVCAVARIGQDAIRSTAVSMAMRQLASAASMPALRAPLGRVWKHSIQVAALSHTLAKRAQHLRPDEAMLAGLVHDIGKLYVLRRAADHHAPCADERALDELVDAWHVGIGRAIVDAWGFPEAVGVAVDEHEELERDPGRDAELADVVLVANLLARHESGEVPAPDWQRVPALGKLALTSSNHAEVLHRSAAEIRAIVDALKG